MDKQELKMFALVDEDLNVASHNGRSKSAIFRSIKVLRNHAWRYKKADKTYKIAELGITEFHELGEVTE